MQAIGGLDDDGAGRVITECTVGEERVAAGSRMEGGTSCRCCVAVKDGGRQVQSAGNEVDATSILPGNG